MPWTPRHTPRIGPGNSRSNFAHTPKSSLLSGRPGPGEITTPSTEGNSGSISCHGVSLNTTNGGRLLIEEISWNKLNVKLFFYFFLFYFLKNSFRSRELSEELYHELSEREREREERKIEKRKGREGSSIFVRVTIWKHKNKNEQILRIVIVNENLKKKKTNAQRWFL